MTRVVFVGASRTSLRYLTWLLEAPGLTVAGVVTAREVFTISYRPEGVRNVLYANVEEIARGSNIPVHVQEESMHDAGLRQTVAGWRPDVILVCGWYHLVPKAIREIAPVLGMHASLLPDYSGGAPLVWAIINGERECGMTLFQMDGGIDSGPIVGQVTVPILPTDTIATVYQRVEDAGLTLLQDVLPRFCRGEIVPAPQDESKRRRFPQRAPADGEIDWRWPARRIYDFVRAQTRPYPGAFTYLGGCPLTIWGASLSERQCGNIAAGTIVRDESDGALHVSCGDGVLLAVTDIEVRSESAATPEAQARLQALPGGAVLGRRES